LPMLPTSGGSIATGATGAYNSYFKSFASKLVADGQSTATIRLGWEMNGNWMLWQGQSNPTAWVAFWKQIVTTMRSVAPKLTFDWAPNVDVAFDPTKLYPGDTYVDYIGISMYDQSWAYAPSQSAQRWSELYNGLYGTYGLAYFASFASSHGKKLNLDEWGMSYRCDGHGGGDDPYYIQQMYNFLTTHNIGWETYFNNDPSSCEFHSINDGRFPQAAALFKKLWATSKPAASATATATPKPTVTATATPKPTVTATATVKPTATATATAKPTGTSTAKPTPTPTSTATAAPVLDVSKSPNRSNPAALKGQKLAGNVYIFLANAPWNTASVTFYMGSTATTPIRVESYAPWDQQGGSLAAANPFNTSWVNAGSHTIKAIVKLATGATQTLTGTFTV
jgi:hypothetical protein